MDYGALRNFKDFLQVYNIMSETCFQRCISSFSSRDITEEEARCVHLCTNKYINMNNKMMQIYMEVQPLILNKRMEEMNKVQSAGEMSPTTSDAKPVQENATSV